MQAMTKEELSILLRKHLYEIEPALVREIIIISFVEDFDFDAYN